MPLLEMFEINIKFWVYSERSFYNNCIGSIEQFIQSIFK